eukprot:scaffold111698_cov33-Tisochrysis_lutea.AAC.4
MKLKLKLWLWAVGSQPTFYFYKWGPMVNGGLAPRAPLPSSQTPPGWACTTILSPCLLAGLIAIASEHSTQHTRQQPRPSVGARHVPHAYTHSPAMQGVWVHDDTPLTLRAQYSSMGNNKVLVLTHLASYVQVLTQGTTSVDTVLRVAC